MLRISPEGRPSGDKGPGELPSWPADQSPAAGLLHQATKAQERIDGGCVTPLHVGEFCCEVTDAEVDIWQWEKLWRKSETRRRLWDWVAGGGGRGSQEFVRRSWKRSENVAVGLWKGETHVG